MPRRGRSRERSPSVDEEVSLQSVLDVVDKCETWGELLRNDFLFEIGIYEDIMYLKELWKSKQKKDIQPE